MRLLIYSPVFPPRVGGIETIVYSIATGLAELKTPQGDPEFVIEFFTPTAAGNFDDTTLPFRMRRQSRPAELWKAIRATDVVHIACPAMLPMILGWLAGKPVIVEHHGFQNICPTGQLLQEPMGQPCPGHFMAGRHLECLRCRPNKNWFNSLKQWLSTWVRRAICPRLFANIMPTAYLGELLQLRNAVTIHHGIPLGDFGGSIAASDTVVQQPVKILYQGRLVNTKGIGVLLDAAHILHQRGHDFELVVIGDGPERSNLGRSAEEMGISSKIRFMGRLSNDEVAEIARDVQIIVVPSIAGEVFGLVLTEHMARAKAVVASDIGAFKEVLGDGGLPFQAGNPEALADQLEKLLVNPRLVAELGQRARQRTFACFERSKMIAEHAALYRKALTASHPA